MIIALVSRCLVEGDGGSRIAIHRFSTLRDRDGAEHLVAVA